MNVFSLDLWYLDGFYAEQFDHSEEWVIES